MNFPNPPITEAIFDIRVNIADEFNTEDMAKLHEEIKEEFPIIQRRMDLKSGVELDFTNLLEVATKVTQASIQQQGYIFISEDKKRIIQATLKGFTFSELAPYKSWASFYGNAYKLWKHYVNIVSPIEVVRVALRSINKIMIPGEDSIELKNYIRSYPELPDNLTASLVDYFMRLVVVHPQYTPSLGIITQTIEKKIGAESTVTTIPLIFDIDVFQNVMLAPNDEKIGEIFENNLRNFRNEIFFKSITEKTQELFQ